MKTVLEIIQAVCWVGSSIVTVVGMFWICATLHELSVSLAKIATWCVGANYVQVQMPQQTDDEAGEFAARVVLAAKAAKETA